MHIYNIQSKYVIQTADFATNGVYAVFLLVFIIEQRWLKSMLLRGLSLFTLSPLRNRAHQ